MTNTFHRNRNLIFLLSLPIMMINKKAASVWPVPPPTHLLSFFLQPANDSHCNCEVLLIIGKECISCCCLFWVYKADIPMILLSELINCHQIRHRALKEFNLLFSVCGKHVNAGRESFSPVCYPGLLLLKCDPLSRV